MAKSISKITTYSFDIDDAEMYGVNAAVILYHIRFWVFKNIANDKHQHDGHYWTYNSISAFEKIFPFFSVKQIRGALKKLEEQGAIVAGNYNNSPYDRTKWYTIPGGHDLPSRANGFSEKGEPIPDNNTYNKKTNKKGRPFSDFYDKYPKKIDKKNAEKKWNKLSIEKQDLAINGIASFVEGKELQFICSPTVYLNGERWNDENPITTGEDNGYEYP